jgi:zinc transporter ZupT
MLPSHKPQQLKLFLAFSGAFLFSITVISIIPELYDHDVAHHIGYWVLGGFFLQIIIDQFSGGIEHGHVHLHMHSGSKKVFVALGVHAFLEGLAGGSSMFDEHVQTNFLFGIALHEIPAAFALVTLLKAGSGKQTVFWMVLYALMTPMGAFISQYALASNAALTEWVPYVVALVIGVFLHISTTILFENSDNHQMSRRKLVAIVIGVGIALLSTLMHFH